jgi:hypothetical protein
MAEPLRPLMDPNSPSRALYSSASLTVSAHLVSLPIRNSIANTGTNEALCLQFPRQNSRPTISVGSALSSILLCSTSWALARALRLKPAKLLETL